MIRPLKRPDNRLILGTGGYGKSTLMRYQIAGRERVIIHDLAGEGENAALASDVIYSERELWERLVKGGWFVIVYRGYQAMTPADPKMRAEAWYRQIFERANALAWAAEDLTVVWEEIDTMTDAGSLPFHAHRIVHQGRHRRIRTIALSRAPHLVPRSLTRNVTRIMVFRISEPRDVDYLGSRLGDAAASLPSLEHYQALDWTERGSRLRKSPFR